jgi:tetratricopeptide (TPR) repeat protein
MVAERATEDQGRLAAPRAPVRAFIVRSGRGAANAVLDHETVLVTLMVITTALSAFSVWQATRASDEADDVGAQARVVQTDTVRESSYLQTLVDHDLNVLRTYCASLVERDVAVATLTSKQPDISGVVAGDLTLRALLPLLRGDAPATPCPDGQPATDGRFGYSIQRAQQSVTPEQASELEGPAVGQAASLTARAARLASQERWLMTAGLVFAIALLGLIMIDVLADRPKRPAGLRDQTVRRSRHSSLAVATASLLLGAAILAWWADRLYLLGISAVLALLIAARARTAVPPAFGGFLRFPARLRGQPHWWAEVLGVLTLVAFSAAALGLSLVTVRERQLRAESERQQVAAQQLLQTNERAALRDLAAVAQLAILDSQVAAANQEQATDDANMLSARREIVAERDQAIEASVRKALAELSAGGSDTACPSAPSVARSADDLLEEGRDRPQVFAAYVSAQQQAVRACDILTALTRDEATGWASRASIFTVALVILGLAGFLLALAADPDRSRHNARWLLGFGGLGMVLGAAFAVSVPLRAIGDAQLSKHSTRVEFSKEVAAGRYQACDKAIATLDRAIGRLDSYGPAFAARATARLCAAAVMPNGPAISSELQKDAVPLVIDDLRRAVRLGPVSPALRADLGWARLLRGLRGGPGADRDLREGLRLSQAATEALEVTQSEVLQGNLSSTWTIHRMRFNVALAHAALDNREAAQGAYERAVRCLDPEARCPGGGLAEQQWREQEALTALGDLELVADSRRMDRYREIIVGSLNPGSPAGPGWNGAQLNIFAQEVQVSGREGDPPKSAVIWYYRPNDKVAWGVLQAPSLKTLHVGDNLNHPVAAEQLLPAGQYRADLYAGGTKTASLLHAGALPATYSRRSSPQLRMSVVVPNTWTTRAETEGVEWSLGPSPTSGLAIRRKEGVTPDAEMTTYLRAQLDQWINERFNRQTTGKDQPPESQYFLGMPYRLVRSYDELNINAAAAFTPYASSPGCGGTLIMGISGGTGVTPEDVGPVFDSVVLDEAPTKLPSIENPHRSGHFSIAVPKGWDATARPPGGTGNMFNTKHCETGTNVLVDERDRESVASFAKRSLKEFRQPGAFPKFKLYRQRSIKVPGSSEALELEFSWQSENGLVWQRQVYATNETTLVFLTFTTHWENVDRFKRDADRIVRSFRLLP